MRKFTWGRLQIGGFEMNKSDFMKKIQNIPEVTPDDADIGLLEEINSEFDPYDIAVNLEDVMALKNLPGGD